MPRTGSEVLSRGLLKTSLSEPLLSYQQAVPTYCFYNIFAYVIGFLRDNTPRNNLESGEKPEQYLLL
jgi:hypothetical protein